MADPNLKIRISTQADVEGAEKAERALRDVDKAASRVESAGKKALAAAGAYAAGALSASAITSEVSKAIDLADRLQDVSEKLGVSAVRLQAIGNVAETSGSSLSGLSDALNFLIKSSQSASTGNKDLEATFARLGITIDDIRSSSPDEIFLKIADAVKNSTDRNRTYADVLKVMGRSAGDLVSTLSQGREQNPGSRQGLWHFCYRRGYRSTSQSKGCSPEADESGDYISGLDRRWSPIHPRRRKGIRRLGHHAVGDTSRH
jgi:hypothetical protein